MRRLALATVVLLAALASSTPAQAIETAELGIQPAGGAARVTAELRPGAATDSAVEVWNKSARPLSIRLGVVPATVEAGVASLGGDDVPVGWVKLAERQVNLGPREHRVVRFRVEPPRELEAGARTVAIVAEPATPGAAVVQRVAVVAYLTPNGSLRATLGWLAWLAAGLCTLAAMGFAISAIRRGGAVRGGGRAATVSAVA